MCYTSASYNMTHPFISHKASVRMTGIYYYRLCLALFAQVVRIIPRGWVCDLMLLVLRKQRYRQERCPISDTAAGFVVFVHPTHAFTPLFAIRLSSTQTCLLANHRPSNLSFPPFSLFFQTHILPIRKHLLLLLVSYMPLRLSMVLR